MTRYRCVPQPATGVGYGAGIYYHLRADHDTAFDVDFDVNRDLCERVALLLNATAGLNVEVLGEVLDELLAVVRGKARHHIPDAGEMAEFPCALRRLLP